MWRAVLGGSACPELGLFSPSHLPPSFALFPQFLPESEQKEHPEQPTGQKGTLKNDEL